MVFDYDAVKTNYGIDLDISTDTLELGDNRTAASIPPPVTSADSVSDGSVVAEPVEAELWER